MNTTNPASLGGQAALSEASPFHAKYWAHALTLHGQGESLDRLSRSIGNARVDLNPHQVDAALFALRSPLSKGVLLADEVGLGKTIEAGLVIAQRWAERKRRILLILPATLRKQWQQELEEKFFIPTLILEKATARQLAQQGIDPWTQDKQVVLCSYQYAASQAEAIRRARWDLVVVDEAHRLRNVYKSGNKTARAIADATQDAPKLLLTATPLQNSLMELYGIVSVIDTHVFGDQESFREQFVRAPDETMRNHLLKERLAALCRRTLRKQVLEYVRFTQRIPITQDFLPSDDEQALYDKVSAYLQRENLVALPPGQRTLMTLVLRKLLASSTFAIAGTLRRLIARLEQGAQPAGEELAEDYDGLDELAEEWEGDDAEAPRAPAPDSAELADLREYANLAERIRQNAKGQALLTALHTGFERAAALGAPQKAVIFTESRRTQQYLLELLGENGYDGCIVLMNGTNTDPLSKEVHARWLERHAGQDVVSGSKSADTKAAIVEEFRERATLLIATESAAEGVNLQFCSLVVNYDLPWNPQRIEQRIGRCHRYGQKHDVVVVNFLNRRNEADQRVFELLSQKFQLFDGVFGASDEVLGALESGVDIERRIAAVYQECRTAEEIQAAFAALQAELDQNIQERMQQTRQVLLDHFDEDVHARLKVHRDEARNRLTERQEWLLRLTRQVLGPDARFDPEAPRFEYVGGAAAPGYYHLDWREAEARGDHFYRVDHPLAADLIDQAKALNPAPAHLVLDYAAYGRRSSVLEELVGVSGWLTLVKLTVESLDTEEFLLLAGVTDDGRELDEDMCQKLLGLPVRAAIEFAAPSPEGALQARLDALVAARKGEVDARNGRYFDEESAKLDRWSEDLKLGLEREIKELDRQINVVKQFSRTAVALEEKLRLQKQVKELEAVRSRKRREQYDAQDAIAEQRDELIQRIEHQLLQRQHLHSIFTFRWSVQ